MGGEYSPSWIKPKVTYINMSGNSKTEPIVWTNTYLDPFTALVKAQCKRYGHDTRLIWIVMTGGGMNDEMVIGHSAPINVWQSSAPPPDGCGDNTYSPTTFVKAWNRCIDSYRANLPATMPS